MAAMIAPFRPLCALLLALVLAFTGQGMAVARGAPGPDGSMVICTGTGPVMIYLDADGTPTSPPHLCPDCAMSLLQTGINAALTLRAPVPVMVRPPLAPQVRTSGIDLVTAQARDPPRLT